MRGCRGEAGGRGDAVASAFTRLYGHQPSGLWSAPGRVNLIGEHTDYNDGLCLPIALPQRTWAAVSPRGDDRLRVTSIDLSATADVALSDVTPGHPSGWAAYLAGVLWAMRQDGLPVTGLDVVLGSEVPMGAGLSSSAAVEGCLAVAASDLFNLGLTADAPGRDRLAGLCQRAENDIVGAPTGGMDQTICLRARAGQAALIDFAPRPGLACQGPAVQFVPFDPGVDQVVLLVMTTHVRHALADGQYAARRQACHQAAAALGVTSLRQISPDDLPQALAGLPNAQQRRAVRHVVTEIARVSRAAAAARSRDWGQFGVLMNDSQASLCDDYQVSSPELDTACRVAIDCGALGARLTGGGFGGSAIALISATAAPAVAPAVAEAFSAAAWPAPQVFPAWAGPAAR